MTKPISPLGQRMIDDMTMRNLSANTQETYIRSVAQFTAFHRRSPDKLGVEHVRDFHLHLVSRGLVANSIAVKMAALRFFYGTTLRRLDIAAEIPTPRRLDRFAGGSCPRGGRATAQGGGRSQAANGAHDDLFGRFAHLRGYAAHGTGYRQRAHGDLRAARQRAQGSLYGPVRPAARYSSRLLPSDTAIALAVSRPQSGPADDQAGVAIGLPARGRGRRAEQVGHGPHVATQFCDPPA